MSAFNPLSFSTAIRRAVLHAGSQRRVFLLVPFAIIAGLLTYCAATYEPDIVLLTTFGFFAFLVFLFALRRGQGLRTAMLILAFWTGYALLSFFGAAFGTSMLGQSVYGTYQAKIVEVLSRSDGEQRVVISNITALKGKTPDIRNARLFVREAPKLQRGMLIEGPMRFAPVPGPAVYGGYDAQFHGYFAGVGAFGSTTKPPTIVAQPSFNPLSLLDEYRETIGIRIDAQMRQPALGIARALTIGDQSHIAPSTRETMSAAGLAHILAISGLHLSLVAGGVFSVIRLGLAAFYKLGLTLPVKKMAAIVGIAVALMYLALSGASVSATRATVMLVLVFGAILAGRQALTMRNVAFAALFVLLTDPASVFRPGFQLSFAAVVALVGVYETFTRQYPREQGAALRLLHFFGGMALTSLVAGAATSVFAAYHFQQTAPLGVLGNVLALPLVGFIVLPAAVFAVLCMPFGIEGAALKVMEWGIDRILEIAQTVARLGEGLNYSPILLPSALVMSVAALAWFAFFSTRIRYLGPVLLLPLIATFSVDTSPDVLIADQTQAIAIRGTDGMALATGRVRSFAVSVWSQTYRETITQTGDQIHCDTHGCIATQTQGQIIAVSKTFSALAEDCAEADLLIARIVVPQWCRDRTQVIDRNDLQTGGVYWAAWNNRTHQYDIRRAIAHPNRPWRIGN